MKFNLFKFLKVKKRKGGFPKGTKFFNWKDVDLKKVKDLNFYHGNSKV